MVGLFACQIPVQTSHSQVCSPRSDMLQEMPMQLLSCKHSSSREQFAVTPEGPVTKKKSYVSSPESTSEPAPKAIRAVIRIRAQKGSRARF